ncbi:MAG: biotin--[acetyl-CoA-carboxylase] ligase [Thermodesulfobacteriota bacterium]|nr:biotin--[acetyl-CoA-carboxylase] ligase [Thermodesulfobacteriota bacterium]
MKEQIIQILNANAGRIVSGVEISRQTGISRVAVWKHVKKLKEEGYGITASSRGYTLKDADDLILPFCFKNREKNIHFFPSLASTMDTAREIARKGNAHMHIVIASEQTQGRGRINRKWRSSPGGLWFTIILEPDLPPPLSFKVNFAASLALVKTVNHLFNIDASVKWPNDILVQGRKLAGFLSEMETRGDMISFVNIGIGLNVNNLPHEKEPGAVSIREIIGRQAVRKDILSSFLDRFESSLPTLHSGSIIDQWKPCTSTIGSRVNIQTMTDTYSGIARDVDETGALILLQDNGEEKRIIYGDCFHQI